MIIKALVILVSILVATFLSGSVIASIMKALQRKESNKKIAHSIQQSSEGAGKIIGWLERFLVLIFIYIGYYQGIGFITCSQESVMKYQSISQAAKNLVRNIFHMRLISLPLIIFSILIFSCSDNNQWKRIDDG
ncbi:MAG: hypothetical protein GXO75_13450, partial [Calditrichaeota bacterium]|nr:hypothetical protein [Calditrichota bacterium]